ncbi:MULTISPECIES: class II aldolase/adducin family protein [Pseudomonas]|uniref:class II aldolase/adducin family protein n=1 Tax=Pseudomonas TaxID=286 RepID=UPI00037DD614|nr:MULTISPECIES: class II aldolase/adducin family protein [Pseudomonas]AYN98111.1 class II aldolase/adducin family protein [Pseudomonas sp. LTGT-11-2Z]MDH0572775.1 class II aldolase/adducin family protein [Pseudomonas fulva]PIK78834.1 class II aldolase [Pseudomonas sp. 382]
MPSFPNAVFSPSEWALRCELAALYRLLAHFKMTDLIDTHISVRLPDSGEAFLINRYGVLFHEIKATDLVKVDLHGDVIDQRDGTYPVNKAGFNIHSAIHSARPDAACVIHTHTAAGIAVSAQEDGLLPLTQHALKFYGCLSYHDYEGIALNPEECPRLVKDLGSNKAMILRNHGLLTLGSSMAEAWNQIYFLERACQAQIQALAGGVKLRFPSEDVCRLTAIQSADEIRDNLHLLAWDAALRLVADQKAEYCS